MNFVNREPLYFINDYPGKIVIFLIGLTQDKEIEDFEMEFLHSFHDRDVRHFETYVVAYDKFYIEALMNSILSKIISPTNYILIPDWFTKTEYECINIHPLLYTITMGFENNLDEDVYDLILTKDKPVGEQLVQYINKLKKGEK